MDATSQQSAPPPIQQIRHAEPCKHLLAIAKDGGIELFCEKCGGRIVIDIAVLMALIAAAEHQRRLMVMV